MKKICSILLTFIFSFYLYVPAYGAKAKMAKSQLEVRDIQTHVYDTADTNQVLKAAINTLQDEGYVILNIEDELGYIQAKKEFKEIRIDKKRMTGYGFLLAYYVACTALTYGIDAPYMYDAIK